VLKRGWNLSGATKLVVERVYVQLKYLFEQSDFQTHHKVASKFAFECVRTAIKGSPPGVAALRSGAAGFSLADALSLLFCLLDNSHYCSSVPRGWESQLQVL
jgi:hypothetical protein